MLSAEHMRSLPAFFADIPDPRRAQGRRHPLPSVLAIATAAVLRALGPIDAKSLVRDPMLRWMFLIPLLFALVFRWGVTPVTVWLSREFGADLGPYHPLLASVIVLNKVTGAPDPAAAEAALRALNPDAAILTADRGAVDPRHLLDTGGFTLWDGRGIELAVQEQVETAIEEADVVLLLVDARDGLTPVDQALVRLLRQHLRARVGFTTGSWAGHLAHESGLPEKAITAAATRSGSRS